MQPLERVGWTFVRQRRHPAREREKAVCVCVCESLGLACVHEAAGSGGCGSGGRSGAPAYMCVCGHEWQACGGGHAPGARRATGRGPPRTSAALALWADTRMKWSAVPRRPATYPHRLGTARAPSFRGTHSRRPWVWARPHGSPRRAPSAATLAQPYRGPSPRAHPHAHRAPIHPPRRAHTASASLGPDTTRRD